MPIHDQLEQHRLDIPESIAATDGKVTLTYSELAGQVDSLANSLLASGVKKGDRVVTLAPPSIEFWVSFLATVSIGAIWSGLNPRYRQHECRVRLEELQAKLILVLPSRKDNNRNHLQEIQGIVNDCGTETPAGVYSFGDECADSGQSYAQLLKRGTAIHPDTLDAARSAVVDSDIAAIVHTSGSTGTPKGAMLSHGAMQKCAAASVGWLGDALQKAVMAVPINHVGGLNNLSMNVFTYGGTIRFLEEFSIESILRIGNEESITYVGHNQTTFTMLLDQPDFSLSRMHACKALVHGGSRTSEKTLANFLPLDASIASVYAQTESCGYLLRSLPDASLEVMANTLGKPLEGVSARIADPTSDEELPIGEVGELQARFDWVFSGYFNNREATEAAFSRDGFLKTGDLCKLRSDGNYELIDRMAQMFKSGGYSIFPTEIEQVICSHPDVAMAAVIGVEDERFGTVGYAFVTSTFGAELSEHALDEYLRTQIANFKIPKTIHILEQMPLLPNTKVDKHALKDLLNDHS